jgi:hypothetical protein
MRCFAAVLYAIIHCHICPLLTSLASTSSHLKPPRAHDYHSLYQLYTTPSSSSSLSCDERDTSGGGAAGNAGWAPPQSRLVELNETEDFFHQVAGHVKEKLRTFNGAVLKPLIKKKHFYRELAFYTCIQKMGAHWMQSAKPFVPEFHDCLSWPNATERRHGQGMAIVPALVPVPMGTASPPLLLLLLLHLPLLLLLPRRQRKSNCTWASPTSPPTVSSHVQLILKWAPRHTSQMQI